MSQKLFESLEFTIKTQDRSRAKALVALAHQHGIDLTEAPGSIRKGLVGLLGAGAIAAGLHATGPNSMPIYQELETKYQQAVEAGDSDQAREIKQDMAALKVYATDGRGNAPIRLAKKYGVSTQLVSENQVLAHIVKHQPKIFVQQGLSTVQAAVKQAVSEGARTPGGYTVQQAAKRVNQIVEGEQASVQNEIILREHMVRDAHRMYIESGSSVHRKLYLEQVNKLKQAKSK
jgi:hypothetical protein